MAIEVTGPEKLELFLRDRPVQWSHLVAARSTLRILPAGLYTLPKQQWLLILRVCFISWAIGKYSAHEMRQAALSAASSKAFLVIPASSTTRSARSTVFSVGRFAASAKSSATSAASAARYAAGSAAGSAIWRAVSGDLSWLTDHSGELAAGSLALTPLWWDVVPRWILEQWRSLMADKVASAEGYAPWIAWYQALLTGDGASADYFGPDLTLRIATQPDEWWDRPAREVNADIAAWLAERDVEKVVIPDPEPGLTFGLAEDGRIGIAPSGIPAPDEQIANEGLLEVLRERVDDLIESLNGSNAFAALSKYVGKYARCLRGQPLSIDRLYLYGNDLENTRAHLQKEINAGDLPGMPLDIAIGLDSVLATHGLLIASTHQGQLLLERSHLYEGKSADIAAQRLAARGLANAVARSDSLFTDEVREEWPALADGIGSGPYPARSTQVAMSGNYNLFVILGKLVTTSLVSEAVINSIPGKLAITSLTATIDAAWGFLTSYLPIITQLVMVSGPLLAWMKPVLRLVARGRLPR